MTAIHHNTRSVLAPLAAGLATLLLSAATADAAASPYRATCATTAAANCTRLRVEVPRKVTKVCVTPSRTRVCADAPGSSSPVLRLKSGWKVRAGKRLGVRIVTSSGARVVTLKIRAAAAAPAPTTLASGSDHAPPAAKPAPAPDPAPAPAKAPGIPCIGKDVALQTAPGAGITTSDSAFAGAPAYYEIGAPTGPFLGKAPRGIALVIHGGGWTANGAGAVEAMRATADRWRARGWQSVNVTYRPCAQSVGDVLFFHDRIRAKWGTQIALCATGESAGGHLSLMVAAAREGVDCVISAAGPTDLDAIAGQTAADKETGVPTLDAGRWLHDVAVGVFGAGNLPQVSAVAHAADLTQTRILQGIAQNDWLISPQQTTTLESAIEAADPGAHVETQLMAPGAVEFVHGSVDQDALDTFRASEDTLAATVAP